MYKYDHSVLLKRFDLDLYLFAVSIIIIFFFNFNKEARLTNGVSCKSQVARYFFN